MEVNGDPEQLLRDQQVVVTYFGRAMHVNKDKDKTGDRQEETTHSTDLTRDDEDEEGKDKTIDTMKKNTIDLEHTVVEFLHSVTFCYLIWLPE